MKFASQFLALVSRVARRVAFVGASCMPLLTPLTALQAATSVANSPGEAFRQLNADNWVSREVTFAELGFTGPLVLGAPDSRRVIYLPVPANVPLSNGEIKLNANYLRADGGRTSLVILLDTYPVSARPFTLEKGDASITLGVAGTPRPNGFVRLGLNWDTALGADQNCTDARPEGKVLRIEPDSRFTYRFDEIGRAHV